jgi:hypothetical protein
MSNLLPFTPKPGLTDTIAVADSSAATEIGTEGKQVLIQNESDTTCHFEFGGSSVVATVADTPILSGESRIFTRNPTHTHIATIHGSTGTKNIYVTPGDGE